MTAYGASRSRARRKARRLTNRPCQDKRALAASSIASMASRLSGAAPAMEYPALPGPGRATAQTGASPSSRKTINFLTGRRLCSISVLNAAAPKGDRRIVRFARSRPSPRSIGPPQAKRGREKRALLFRAGGDARIVGAQRTDSKSAFAGNPPGSIPVRPHPRRLNIEVGSTCRRNQAVSMPTSARPPEVDDASRAAVLLRPHPQRVYQSVSSLRLNAFVERGRSRLSRTAPTLSVAKPASSIRCKPGVRRQR